MSATTEKPEFSERYFLGRLPNADGMQAWTLLPKSIRNLTNATWPLAPDFTGCAYPIRMTATTAAGFENNMTTGTWTVFYRPANGLNAIGYYVQNDLALPLGSRAEL